MSLTAAAVALMIGSAAPEAGTLATTDAATLQTPVALQLQPGGQTEADPQQPSSAAAGTVSPEAQPDAVPEAGPESAGAEENVPADGAVTTHGQDIIVTHRKRPPPGDPLQNINAESFKAVQAVDKAVLEPVATAYNKGLPRPVRQGLRNFFNNLDEPVVFAAYLLQFKPGKAAETAGRFLINSTLGVAGLMDVAKRKPFNLPYRPNGLANVLGYYGVGPGPYMYLPIIGPTTLRDFIGDSVDNLVAPGLIFKPLRKPEVALPMAVLNALGERAAFDEEIGKIRKADNPYATYRELYLRQRKAEIDALHGRITPDVVPVYGPGMKTAGKKKGEQDEPAAQDVENPADQPGADSSRQQIQDQPAASALPAAPSTMPEAVPAAPVTAVPVTGAQKQSDVQGADPR